MFLFSLVKRLVQLVVLGAVSYFLVSGVQVVLASRTPGAVAAAPKRPVAIVAATGSASGPLDADFSARLGHAAALAAAGRVGRVAVFATSEAQALRARAYLGHHGVPARDVSSFWARQLPGDFHLYDRSKLSRQALLVSDSWQVLWLDHLAAADGVQVVASPIAPTNGGIGNEASTIALQAAAVCWGRIAGFTQTGFIAG